MDMLFPTVDMPLPDYAPMGMLLPTVDMPLPGYAPMDMLLPTMDMPLPGYAPMDMLLWIRSFQLWICPCQVDMLSWICSSQLWICFLPATNMLLSTTVDTSHVTEGYARRAHLSQHNQQYNRTGLFSFKKAKT